MLFNIKKHMDLRTFFRLVRREESETPENMSQKTHYYIMAYHGRRTFNWSAAFFGPFWFLFRNMYFFSFLVLGFYHLFNKLSDLFFPNDGFSYLFVLPFLLWGFLANPLYFRYLHWIRQRGCLRSGASGSMVVWSILVFAIAAIELPGSFCFSYSSVQTNGNSTTKMDFALLEGGYTFLWFIPLLLIYIIALVREEREKARRTLDEPMPVRAQAVPVALVLAITFGLIFVLELGYPSQPRTIRMNTTVDSPVQKPQPKETKDESIMI